MPFFGRGAIGADFADAWTKEPWAADGPGLDVSPVAAAMTAQKASPAPITTTQNFTSRIAASPRVDDESRGCGEAQV